VNVSIEHNIIIYYYDILYDKYWKVEIVLYFILNPKMDLWGLKVYRWSNYTNSRKVFKIYRYF